MSAFVDILTELDENVRGSRLQLELPQSFRCGVGRFATGGNVMSFLLEILEGLAVLTVTVILAASCLMVVL